MNKTIRVVIADDHAIVRTGLVALMSATPDIEVVGEAKDGDEAVRVAAATHPDVIVMDLMMPRKDGIAATADIHAAFPEMKVVLLTTFGTSDGIAKALAAGAVGALLKNSENTELLAAIRSVADGGMAVSPAIRHLLRKDPPVAELTHRQQEILKSVTRGLSNREIAESFGISPESVKSHLTAIFNKIGSTTRSEAVAIALRKQLLKF